MVRMPLLLPLKYSALFRGLGFRRKFKTKGGVNGDYRGGD